MSTLRYLLDIQSAVVTQVIQVSGKGHGRHINVGVLYGFQDQGDCFSECRENISLERKWRAKESQSCYTQTFRGQKVRKGKQNGLRSE